MHETVPLPIYHPRHLPDAPDTDTAFAVDDPFIAAVPAHDLPRALAWSVARALRLNPESSIIPVQGYGIPPASGGGAMRRKPQCSTSQPSRWKTNPKTGRSP